MEQFDNMIKEMAEKEEIIVPNGFDERLQNVLDTLPAPTKKGLGAAKIILVAAAICAALLCTAFAASPGLRGMLAEALGSFAPYAQEQEDKAYIMDGFEVKVLSALSDGSTIRAYVQVKDLRGHRLSADMEPYGAVNVLTEEMMSGPAVDGLYWSFSFDPGYAVYNEEDETALLVFTGWGQNFGDLSNAKLEIRHIYDFKSRLEVQPAASLPPGTEANSDGDIVVGEIVSQFKLNEVQLTIPLTVESTDKLTFDKDSAIAKALNAEWVELSPLGFTAAFEHGTPDELIFNPIQVRMKDGRLLDWENQGEWNPSGSATYCDREYNRYGVIKIWNFPDAIELDQVESICVCGKYFPVK